MKILVTGEAGFVGKNLVENLKNICDGKNQTRPNISIDEICELPEKVPPKSLNFLSFLTLTPQVSDSLA